MLQALHDAARRKRFTISNNQPLVDIHLAREMRRLGDIDGAIELARITSDTYFRSGELMWLGAATAVLVESLLHADPKRMCGKPVLRLRNLRPLPARARRGSSTRSGCFDFGRCLRRQKATKAAIATSGTATATMAASWASRAT